MKLKKPNRNRTEKPEKNQAKPEKSSQTGKNRVKPSQIEKTCAKPV